MDTYKIIPYNKFKNPESHHSYWKSKAVECMKEMGVLDSILIHNRTYETVSQWIRNLERRMAHRRYGLKMKFILQREYRLGSADDKKFREENNNCPLLRIIKMTHEKIALNNKYEINHINHLNLSPRTHNCLQAGNIESIAELTYIIKKEPIRLLRLKNFGRRSLKEITTALTLKGVQL